MVSFPLWKDVNGEMARDDKLNVRELLSQRLIVDYGRSIVAVEAR